MPHRIILRGVSLIATFLVAMPAVAFAAALSFTPASDSFGVGKTFTVMVVVDSTDPFNSGNATIAFDKEFLSVEKVSKESSAFSLWAVEPSSSNSAGTVSFEGGNTTPLSGKKNLLAITFKALKEGKANVSFTTAAILAADGKGTDVAKEKTPAVFTVTAASTPTPSPQPHSSVSGVTGETPTLGLKPDLPENITSPTHPEEAKWYNPAKAKFVWDTPADITTVRLSLDTKADTVPTTSYDPPISEKEFDTLSDGVMYFHLRYQNDAGWGPTAHRKIQVDKTPPEKFTLEAIVDPAKEKFAVLKFMATDTLSGVDHYGLIIDGGQESKIGLLEVKPEGYELSDQIPGEHSVKVKAYDKAGNFTEAERKTTIPGTIPKPADATAEEVVKPTDWKLISIIGLIALIGFLIGYLLYERSAFRHEKFIIKREADEVRDANANIFAALREEVGEQVGLLFQAPNPSAQDREVLGRINEAVDLSEELLAKEVEDVRKLLM
jgi:hypothetical protein